MQPNKMIFLFIFCQYEQNTKGLQKDLLETLICQHFDCFLCLNREECLKIPIIIVTLAFIIYELGLGASYLTNLL